MFQAFVTYRSQNAGVIQISATSDHELLSAAQRWAGRALRHNCADKDSADLQAVVQEGQYAPVPGLVDVEEWQGTGRAWVGSLTSRDAILVWEPDHDRPHAS